MGAGIARGSRVNMSSSAAAFVKNAIVADPLVIFSKTTCPYCEMAKKVLDKYKARYKTIELDDRDDAAIIQSVLGELTGAATVPRVFVGGKCIGGGSETKQLDSEGKLEGMLREAGVELAA